MGDKGRKDKGKKEKKKKALLSAKEKRKAKTAEKSGQGLIRESRPVNSSP